MLLLATGSLHEAAYKHVLFKFLHASLPINISLAAHAQAIDNLRHEPVPSVIYMSGYSPPARSNQLSASFSFQGLQFTDRWVRGVAPEGVLLGVSSSKGAVTQCLHAQDPQQARI